MEVALNLLGMPSVWQGGAGVYAGQLAVALATRDDTELRILCPPSVARELDELAPGAHVIEVAELRPRRVRQAFDLARALWQPSTLRGSHALPKSHGLGTSEVVHYPMSYMAPPNHDRATVVTALDLQHLDRPHGFPRREILSRRLRWHTALRGADRVIAISQFTRDSVVEHLGLDPGRVDVVHLCAHPSFFEPAEPVEDPPQGDFLFYPASPYPHKNHDRLVRVFGRLAGRHPGLRLVFSGGPIVDWTRVRGEVATAGLDGRVEIAGHLSVAQLRAHYVQARAMVFPSLYEGFGIPLVEAMALGCPVVAARAGSIPEVVGEEGRLFDPRSDEDIEAAIEDALSVPDGERREAAESGRRRAERFTIERMALDTLRTYERAVATGAGAR